MYETMIRRECKGGIGEHGIVITNKLRINYHAERTLNLGEIVGLLLTGYLGTQAL